MTREEALERLSDARYWQAWRIWGRHVEKIPEDVLAAIEAKQREQLQELVNAV